MEVSQSFAESLSRAGETFALYALCLRDEQDRLTALQSAVIHLSTRLNVEPWSASLQDELDEVQNAYDTVWSNMLSISANLESAAAGLDALLKSGSSQ